MGELIVFICYGGDEGRLVGERLRVYLLSNGIRAVMVSPESSDVLSGEDTDIAVKRLFEQSYLMIVICTEGIHRSEKALKEIEWAQTPRISMRVIPFISDEMQVPESLKKYWHPIKFNPTSPEERFERLELEIRRIVMSFIDFYDPRIIGEDAMDPTPTRLRFPVSLLQTETRL